MATENKKPYEMMQTKVSPETFERIKQIEAKLHLKAYGLIQNMVDCIVRYMDDRHNLTPEIEQAMSIFEHLIGWADALNLADPTVKKEVAEAVYFLEDPQGMKKGVRAVHVTRPYFDEWKQDYNVQHILDRTIRLLFPDVYKRLLKVMEHLDFKSITEFLNFVVDHFQEEADIEELRNLFEDAARAENTKDIEYGNRTKRTKRQDIEKQRGLFDLEDLDFSPHGGTW
jgi:hypothetical protein